MFLEFSSEEILNRAWGKVSDHVVGAADPPNRVSGMGIGEMSASGDVSGPRGRLKS